jgi:hypothetical protein
MLQESGRRSTSKGQTRRRLIESPSVPHKRCKKFSTAHAAASPTRPGVKAAHLCGQPVPSLHRDFLWISAALPRPGSPGFAAFQAGSNPFSSRSTQRFHSRPFVIANQTKRIPTFRTISPLLSRAIHSPSAISFRSKYCGVSSTTELEPKVFDPLKTSCHWIIGGPDFNF